MRVQDHKDTVIQDLFELKAVIKPVYILTITAIGPVISIFLMGEKPILVVELSYENSSNSEFDDAYNLIKSKINLQLLVNNTQKEQGCSLAPAVYSSNNQLEQQYNVV